MKPTIYTTANSAYFPFAYMFVSSIKDNFPEEKLNKIIINDLGLSQVQRNRLSGLCSKIEYIKTIEENVGEITVHTEEWRKAVDQKTLGLQEICKEENYPIVMIDSDTYVLKDFSDEIFDDCDIQVCKNENDKINGQGYYLTHIASWFVVNNKKGGDFVKRWRKTMPEINSVHVETPALCETLKYSAGVFNIRDNKEYVVSSRYYDNDPKIIHFRSDPGESHRKESIEDRITNVKNLSNEFIEKNKIFAPNAYLRRREGLNDPEKRMEDCIEHLVGKHEEKLQANDYEKFHEELFVYYKQVKKQRDGSTSLLDCKLLQLLCWESNPRNILEVGTYIGATAYAMAFSTEKTKADIHTVDFREDDVFYRSDVNPAKRINVWKNMSSSHFLSNATLKNVDLFFIDAFGFSEWEFEKMYEIANKKFIFAVHDYYDAEGKFQKGHIAINGMLNVLERNNAKYKLHAPKKEHYHKGHKNVGSCAAFLTCEK